MINEMALREIEDELNRENSECLFVTAFVAVVDVDSGLMEYVCAGHDAPIVLRRGQASRVDTADIGGPPLCAAGDYPYRAGSLQLQPGDLLCLFTDGVTEARADGEMFGIERLMQLTTAVDRTELPAAVASLRDAVRGFEAGRPPADDLTLLLLRWNGAAV